MKPSDAPKLPGWVTLAEFADMRGVTQQAVYKMAEAEKFKTLHRIGDKPLYAISTSEALALLAKRGPRRILIAPGVKPKPDGVAYAIQWCRTTRRSQSPFTLEMDRHCPELAGWARGGYQGMTWPNGRAVPPKEMIADFLERKLTGEMTDELAGW